jgi:hypothetical protein
MWPRVICRRGRNKGNKIDINNNLYRTIHLPVVLYGYETWSVTLREEHRLRVSENRVQRGICGPKGQKVTAGWGRPHNELYDLYTSPNQGRWEVQTLNTHRRDEKRIQNFGPKTWRHHGPPKRWYPTTSLHSLKMEAATSPETSVSYHITTRTHKSEDNDFDLHRRANFKAHVVTFSSLHVFRCYKQL